MLFAALLALLTAGGRLLLGAWLALRTLGTLLAWLALLVSLRLVVGR